MALIGQSDLDKRDFLKIDPNAEIAYNPGVDPEPAAGEQKQHSLSTIAGAAWRSSANIFANIGPFLSKDRTVSDPNFNPYNFIEKIDPNNLDAYSYADSEEEIDLVNTQLDKERRDRQILQESGWWGTAALMAAEVLDPTMLIPGVAGLHIVRKAGTGVRIGTGAATGAALTGGAVGIQEAIASQGQLSRTAQESYTNMFFGGVLGGVFGGALGAMAKGSGQGMDNIIRHIDSGVEPKVDLTTGAYTPAQDLGVRSTGAAELSLAQRKASEGLAYLDYRTLEKINANLDKGNVLKTSIQKKMRAQEKIFKYTSAPVETLRSPIIRGMTSEFSTPRRIVNAFFEHSFITGRHLEGEAITPIETRLKEYQGMTVMLEKDARSLYFSHAGVSGEGIAPSIQARIKAQQQKGEVLTYPKFKEEIARSIRSGKEHAIAEVNQAAAKYKAHFHRLAKELQGQGYLTHLSPDEAAKYLPRKYNMTAVLENRSKFRDIISASFQRGIKNKEWNEAVAKGAPTEGIEKWIHRPIDDLLDANERADGVIDNILGMGDEAMSVSDMAGKVGTTTTKATKHRTLLVDDSEIEEFLSSDLDAIVGLYTHKTGSLIEFQRMLTANNWETALDIKRDLRRDLDDAVRANPAQEAALTKKFNSDVKLVDDMINIIMGNIDKSRTSKGAQALQALRKYQTVTKLGGVVLSSLGDPMMGLFKHGLPNTMRSLRQVVTDFKAVKMEGDAAKQFGLALEIEQNNMLRALHDGDAAAGQESSLLRRAGDSVMEMFGKVSLLSYWDTVHRRFAGHTSGMRTLKGVEMLQGNKISLKEKARLAQLGIGKLESDRIWNQVQRFSEQVDGQWLSNLHLWDDQEAARLFGASMVKDADATILKPGLGDLPVVYQSSQVAKTVLQFRSFGMAATNRLLLNGMQRRDMDALTGVIALVSMGALVSKIKADIAGREFDEDLNGMIMEGITRSGLQGFMGDYILAFNPFSKNSKYLKSSARSMMLGPSGETVLDVVGAYMQTISDKGMTQKEAEKLYKLMPFQNLFYLRLLLEKSGER